jgi:hypothetical protein
MILAGQSTNHQHGATNLLEAVVPAGFVSTPADGAGPGWVELAWTT